jgi:ferric-dicitrate binding protein FerR (iron transport regulator)
MADPQPQPRRRSPAFLWVAAAVIVAIAAWLASANRGPAWHLDGAAGSGSVIAEGRAIPLEDTRELERAIQPGRRIRLPAGARLDLALPGLYRLQLDEGTEILVPSAPGRWFWRVSRGTVFAGTARFATAPGFRGSRLVVETPEGTVEVSSATFAVAHDSSGSSVCALEGDVEVAQRGGPRAVLEAGACRALFADGRPARSGPIPTAEETKLVLLRERARRL